MKDKPTIAVVMGGMSPEYEISLETGKEILEQLNRNKYEVVPVKISERNMWYVEGSRREIHDVLENIDVVFNAAHGQYGEDGKLQAIFDIFQVPYTGSGVAASALAFDKIRSRDLFKFNKIAVPASIVFRKDVSKNHEEARLVKAALPNSPWVVKPVRAGSSVGVSIVKEESGLSEAFEAAFQYDKEILVEEYLDGREFTCGVLENFNGQEYFALPVVEIIPPEKYEFFDYEAKYNPETQEIVPADIPKELSKQFQDIAINAHRILGCELYSRSDMILKDNTIYLLETNTLPGLTSNSLYPKEAKAVGLSFPELLDKFIEETIKRS